MLSALYLKWPNSDHLNFYRIIKHNPHMKLFVSVCVCVCFFWVVKYILLWRILWWTFLSFFFFLFFFFSSFLYRLGKSFRLALLLLFFFTFFSAKSTCLFVVKKLLLRFWTFFLQASELGCLDLVQMWVWCFVIWWIALNVCDYCCQSDSH